MATIKDFINNLTQTKKPNLGTGFLGTPKPTTGNFGGLVTPKPTTPVVNQTLVPKPNTSNGATSPKPTVIAPPNTPSITSNPKETFINNLTNTGAPKIDTPTTPTTPSAPVSNPQNDYLEYLRGQFSPEKGTKLSTAKESALTRVNEVQARNRKAELDAIAAQEKERYTPGGLLGGTQKNISEIGRKANLEGAYGALEENAAVASANLAKDTYNDYINAGKSVYEAEQAALKNKEGFSLGKDQTRYEYNSSTGQYEKIGGGSASTTSGTYTPGVDQNADAWVKYVQNGGKITDVPDEYQNAVAQGTTTQGKPQSEISKQVSSVIDELLLNPGLSRISGPTDQLLGGAFGDAALAKNKYNQLKGLLSLDNIKYLKGTGAISDAEQRLLANAASAIGRNLSDEDFRKELIKLKEGLTAVNSGSAGGEQLTSDEIQFLKTKGYTDAEIQSSFSNVGKTTASNIPQKNKNPGNVKQGGLADKLAIGVDRQGHLIFPDEQTGFEAMKMDLEAKVNGRSRYLPANPTIAELGKVYAEDPNWGESVASILGVSPTTNTKMIPISNLVQAIARQEGYYA